MDSVITLRRRYELRTQRMLKALVDTSLGLHWEWHCQDSRLPTYVEEMQQLHGTKEQRCALAVRVPAMRFGWVRAWAAAAFVRACSCSAAGVVAVTNADVFSSAAAATRTGTTPASATMQACAPA